MRSLQRLVIPVLLIMVGCFCYWWHNINLTPPEPPGYREGIKHLATGVGVEELLRHWSDRQDVSEAMEY